VLERAQRGQDLVSVGSVRQLDRGLQHDRPRVHSLVDEVDGDAEDLHAVRERLADRVESRERRQQRRVDVEDAVGEAGQELGPDELHVAGEHDELDAVEDDEPEFGRRTPAWARALVYGAAALALLLVGATVGLVIGRWQSTPVAEEDKPNAVDIGFCQDMSVHHRQAVEMGDIARLRGHSREVRVLGYDISSTQNGQIGRMQGWLTLWDAPAQAPGELMTWMKGGHGGHGTGQHAQSDDVPMPGMATEQEMRKLRRLSGREFDVFFLQLMLRHHQGGTAMAEYAVEHARIPAVRALAQSMLDSQGSEMKVMRAMLEQLGAEPLPF